MLHMNKKNGQKTKITEEIIMIYRDNVFTL